VIGVALAIAFAFDLRGRGVEMVGALPTGLPRVSAPLLSGQLWASAALVVLSR
jgi:hypothetical protein